MNPNNHTRFIVLCITGLAMMATGAGAYLLLKGFQQGELLAQMGSNGLSGLVGFLGGKMASEVKTGTGGAIQTEVVNRQENPVPTTESPK